MEKNANLPTKTFRRNWFSAIVLTLLFLLSHGLQSQEPTSVTIAGNLQDELGCPGDWQPDCLRSWLQDPDGDGTYEFFTDLLPPGAYECKVAHDESWDEN